MALDILTKNPETWKKTIFILCYDENDGYFDHVPPFCPPNPADPSTGKVSNGINAAVEYVTFGQDKVGRDPKNARESVIGLGYRVPLVIASPWSRGGAVCSEVFDHTSILQFLEKFVQAKTGKKVEETNISAWRRTICGDLTSVFTPYDGEKLSLPVFPQKEHFIQEIHQAQFTRDPFGYQQLNPEDIDTIRQHPKTSSLMPRQEPGTRPSRALPYELLADGWVEKSAFNLSLGAANNYFSDQAAGACFLVYDELRNRRAYTVKAGDVLKDAIPVNGNYDFEVFGVNGFYRRFKGLTNQTGVDLQLDYEREARSKRPTGSLKLNIVNHRPEKLTLRVTDNAYGHAEITKTVGNARRQAISLPTKSGWYDLTFTVRELPEFQARYAGRVETGRESISDPAMA